MARQREIGIRLSLGATRRRIVRQLLTESLLLALGAAAARFAISRVVLKVIVDAVMSSMAPDLGDVRLTIPDADWRVCCSSSPAPASRPAFFGLAPALQATRIEPLRTMRGEVVRGRPAGTIAKHPDRLPGQRLGAAADLRRRVPAQHVGVRQFDPGMRTEDTVIVQVVNESRGKAMVQAVTAEPSVDAVAVSGPKRSPRPRTAFVESGAAKAAVAYKFVSPEYFDVLDIPIVRGRAFTLAERTSNSPSPSFPKRPRARCGRMPMRSVRSCGSIRIHSQSGASRNRRSNREHSRSSASPETWTGYGSDR